MQTAPTQCWAVSPDSILHVVPSDKKSTLAIVRGHGIPLAHGNEYLRNLLGFDNKNAREESYGWVRVGPNVKWLKHDGLNVIIAVTGLSNINRPIGTAHTSRQ